MRIVHLHIEGLTLHSSNFSFTCRSNHFQIRLKTSFRLHILFNLIPKVKIDLIGKINRYYTLASFE